MSHKHQGRPNEGEIVIWLLKIPKEVMVAAQELCPNEGRLQRVREDVLWNTCALFQPVRVSFACTPGPPPPSEFQ